MSVRSASSRPAWSRSARSRPEACSSTQSKPSLTAASRDSSSALCRLSSAFSSSRSWRARSDFARARPSTSHRRFSACTRMPAAAFIARAVRPTAQRPIAATRSRFAAIPYRPTVNARPAAIATMSREPESRTARPGRASERRTAAVSTLAPCAAPLGPALVQLHGGFRFAHRRAGCTGDVREQSANCPQDPRKTASEQGKQGLPIPLVARAAQTR